MTKQDYEAAEEQYRGAVELDPENSGLHYNLGLAYASMESYEQALEQQMAAVQLDAKNGPAHNALAVNYYMLDQIDMAKEHIKIAQRLGVEVQKELLKALKIK
jgi:tetratricopeptide (TPR) repeat protein